MPGRRWSAANAYLRPAMKRANVQVKTHALATAIVFEGKRATGVRYRHGGGEHLALAAREVVLAGGPINSPQLLKLSGIGPADELTALGIPVRRRSSRRRRESPGPSRVLFPGRLEGADHAVLVDGPRSAAP